MDHGARSDAFENFSTRRCASFTARTIFESMPFSETFERSIFSALAFLALKPSNFATRSRTAASPRALISASAAAAAFSASSGNAGRALNFSMRLSPVFTILIIFFRSSACT